MKLDTSASIWQGKRVHLRAIEPSDWETYWAWNEEDTEQSRNLYFIPFPGSQERQKRWAEREAVRDQQDQNWRFVMENNEGEVVGDISTKNCDPRIGHLHYGLNVAREHRRKGYASEAILLVLRYYFQELRYQKATISLYSFNEATIALHESLGYQLEGRIRRAVFTKGQYFDELLVGITAEEFAEKHAHKFS